MLEDLLRDSAAATPDPERALKNLLSFCDLNPDRAEDLTRNIRQVSLLFSVSQFLANFSSSNPDALFESLRRLHDPVLREDIAATLRETIQGASRDSLPGVVRTFKKKSLLLLTLRDILNVVDIVDSMLELSLLADVIVEESVKILRTEMSAIYGDPADDAFAVISVGKLGGDELNFSSDIDLLYVYGTEEGETRGIVTAGGIVKNRISNHEYYCKLGERLTKFLSMNTAEGFAYRVDLRLRPEGQRGSLAMSLPAYEMYYESWGQSWERAVLLRARPVAGDTNFGRAFVEMIGPFVYRKYLDFGALDEIRRMKTKIDEVFKKDDIKRGFGGIREIEFFAQALQLIYGGREPLLRERSVLRVLHRLLQKNLIGHGDCSILIDNYLFLRRLEHRLQQVNDLQTHQLPSDEGELAAMARKMGFHDSGSFVSLLEERRRSVRIIYDSLFTEAGLGRAGGETLPGSGEEIPEETAPFFAEDLSSGEIKELLGKYSLQDRDKAARNVLLIKDSASSFQTLRGRRLLGQIIPVFLLEALRSRDPDAALNNLQSFAVLLSSEESYLERFAQNKSLIPALTRIFERSEYILKKITRRIDYLEFLGREILPHRTIRSLNKELQETLASGTSLSDAIRMLRQTEEIRMGLLFLDGKIDAVKLIKRLGRTAEAIVSTCTDKLAEKGFLTLGMGKLGGREITFDSDLDLVFVCEKEVPDRHVKTAERLIRLLTSYTKDGAAYRVDARLRPEGTKGPLVASIDALNTYYLHTAHFWELQALLKARPVGGDRSTAHSFTEMRERILKKRGGDVSAADIRGMRERIRRELSREKEGYDIKLGRGGIEELEFTVQYLQLLNGGRHPGLFVQSTLDAIRRLASAGIIGRGESERLKEIYIFYRTLESFMRLSGQSVLKPSGVAHAAEFMGFGQGEDFLKYLADKGNLVRQMFEKLLP